MTVFLEGVAAQFYRGIGAETQFIAPFSRMNFFIGANNAGKSVVLNLIADHVADAVKGEPSKLKDNIERYLGETSGQFALALGCSERAVAKTLSDANRDKHFQQRNGGAPTNLMRELQSIASKLNRGGLLWNSVRSRGNREVFPPVDPKLAQDWSTEWYSVWQSLTGQGGGSALAHWIPETLDRFAQVLTSRIPEIHLIPAKRILGEKDHPYTDQSGKGLMDELAKLQNPDHDKQGDLEKFERINRFLRDVTGKPNARLTVPSERNHLLVHMDNKVLPLSSLGTGIHEVILLAAFSTIHDGSIMCIEEPEIHLHPVLQRKLIAYLAANTSSQYFIATHSAAFMDTPGAHIFHVTNDGLQTRVRPALTKDNQRKVLDDLGYHASDILQANSVIWVEGPSDRIYLNHWISHVDDRLIEGIHYSIMFYGGALIRHLSASDEAVEEFIQLRQLNRNTAILMDSDRENATAPLKKHAQRIVDEMAREGIAWITAGREVENYISGNRLQEAMRALHPKVYKAPCPTGEFDHAFYFYRDDPAKVEEPAICKDGDKVGAAKLICADPANLDRLDLRDRLSELCMMICKANGIEPKGIN